MAMRPMFNDRHTVSRADLLVVSALFAVALLLVLIAQALGFTLL